MSGTATADELDDLLGPEPEAEVLPPLETPRRRSRPMGEASRALLERSRSYDVMRAAPRKNSVERLQRLCSYMSEMPVQTDACARAGISVTTLKYWLQKSSEGKPGDGFDMPMGDDDENGEGDTIRFHDAWDAAVEMGVGRTEVAVHLRATGYDEPQVYRGRVQYKLDPEKCDAFTSLGLPIDALDPNLWLRDGFGAPVPETVRKMDPDLAMFILKTRKASVYGAKASMDINVKGGVLVVGMQAKTPEDLNLIEADYRREGRPPVLFEEGDGDD